MDRRNFVGYPWVMTLAVALVLLIISLIPPSSIGGISLRRANILSDIYTFKDSVQLQEQVVSSQEAATADSLFNEQMIAAQRADSLLQASKSSAISKSSNLTPSALEQEAKLATKSKSDIKKSALPIENYGEGDKIAALRDKLSAGDRVRIAFLGDSFVESDILTCDLRESLQKAFGGSGVGMLPFASPFSAALPTQKFEHSGWQLHTITKHNSEGDSLRGHFSPSGSIATIQSKKATSHYKTTHYRKGSSKFYRARVVFKSPSPSKITLRVNDSLDYNFVPVPSASIQEVVIDGLMNEIEVTVQGDEQFLGYGVSFESKYGVTVDNFSQRGSSGLPLLSSDYTTSRQIDDLLGYDMIILQYGLNVMTKDVAGYDYYESGLIRLIKYMSRCFPNASVLVMGVGDRAFVVDDPHAHAHVLSAMVGTQRAAADSCGVMFWDTRAVMQNIGGIISMVEDGMAAKDYTHLSYSGGRYIGRQLASAIALSASANGTAESPKAEPLAISVTSDSVNNSNGEPTDTAELLFDSIAIDTAHYEVTVPDSIVREIEEQIARDTTLGIGDDSVSM